MIFRNMICAYFYQRGSTPLDPIKQIPESQVIHLLNLTQKFDIKTINELFLRVLFKKIKPNKYFDCEKELRRIKRCTKLEYLKKVYVRQLLFIKSFLKDKARQLCSSSGIAAGPSSKKPPVSIVAEELHSRHHCGIVCLTDHWFMLTMKGIICNLGMVEIAEGYFMNLKKMDAQKLAIILFNKGQEFLPVLKDIFKPNQNLEKEETNGEEKSQIMNFLRLIPGSSNSFGDTASQLSGFSFNFQQRLFGLQRTSFEV